MLNEQDNENNDKDKDEQMNLLSNENSPKLDQFLFDESSNESKENLLSQSDFVLLLSKDSEHNQYNLDANTQQLDTQTNLNQSYINSLRKEIRFLLQERSEYKTILNNSNSNFIENYEHKIDLLEKCLEEKNLFIDRFQLEYDLIKEKNNFLLNKIHLLESDRKSSMNLIDQLKQNINDLNVDLKNNFIIKQNLELSIRNLETYSQNIDNERFKLTNDIKLNQSIKQDLEKSLQKTNVIIAEQGLLNIYN